MKRVFIEHIESYLPEQKITNEFVEQKIKQGGFDMPEGLLEKMIGSELRYYAEKDEQVSDLAATAARKVLAKVPDRKIDLLIFAACHCKYCAA